MNSGSPQTTVTAHEPVALTPTVETEAAAPARSPAPEAPKPKAPRARARKPPRAAAPQETVSAAPTAVSAVAPAVEPLATESVPSAPPAVPASPSTEPATPAPATPAKRRPRRAATAKPPELAASESPRPTRAKSTKPRTRAKKPPVEVPPLLLEGDRPAAPPPGGPGQRYALGPTPPVTTPALIEEEGELPEAYGTQRLLLTARDPHCLYAHWDFSREQLQHYNALSADGHLVLRVYINAVAGEPYTQVHVHPESRNWFVHVRLGGTRYVAELGYFNRSGQWHALATSTATLTPPETMAEETTVRLATIPAEVPFQQLVELVKTVVSETVPLAEAIQQLRATAHPDLPTAEAFAAAHLTPAQERALAEVVSLDESRRVWIGSLEVTEVIRRQWERGISSAQLVEVGAPVPAVGALGSLASPFGGVERPKGFWFNVNAELIIYGATERDAEVAIGGRVIQLRPDGTFSFRFALPDGAYELPVTATAPDKADSRRAELKFSRATAYAGAVGAHPQDAALKAPEVANVS
ncbi:MAG: DUF4912 domain-containing protein [Verrucomicrobia bacterium]|nr:DUF4912 domain-containing protein [Verrucomicrobiota bacterium]